MNLQLAKLNPEKMASLCMVVPLKPDD